MQAVHVLRHDELALAEKWLTQTLQSWGLRPHVVRMWLGVLPSYWSSGQGELRLSHDVALGLLEFECGHKADGCSASTTGSADRGHIEPWPKGAHRVFAYGMSPSPVSEPSLSCGGCGRSEPLIGEPDSPELNRALRMFVTAHADCSMPIRIQVPQQREPAASPEVAGG